MARRLRRSEPLFRLNPTDEELYKKLSKLAAQAGKEALGSTVWFEHLDAAGRSDVAGSILEGWFGQHRSAYDYYLQLPSASIPSDVVSWQMKLVASEVRKEVRKHQREIGLTTESEEGEMLPGLEGIQAATAGPDTTVLEEQRRQKAQEVEFRDESSTEAARQTLASLGSWHGRIHRMHSGDDIIKASAKETYKQRDRKLKEASEDYQEYHGQGLSDPRTCPTCKKIAKRLGASPEQVRRSINETIATIVRRST